MSVVAVERRRVSWMEMTDACCNSACFSVVWVRSPLMFACMRWYFLVIGVVGVVEVSVLESWTFVASCSVRD